MKIYTKTGDDGSTGLLGPGRLSKDATRIEGYGTVDELNAALGLARACGIPNGWDTRIKAVQDDLFIIGAALADPVSDGPFHNALKLSQIERLEAEIDDWEATLPPLTQFILPAGSPSACHVHVARAVCRRAERLVVRLQQTPGESVPATLVVYLNRLSDYLFVLARAINHANQVPDEIWHGLK